MTVEKKPPATSKYRALHIGMCVRKFAHTEGKSQVLIGLLHALGKLDEGSERYTIVVESPEMREWLEPYCAVNQEIVVHRQLGKRSGMYHAGLAVGGTAVGKTLLAPLRPMIRYVQHMLSVPRMWPEIPVSDGVVEQLGCDVVHFPQQWYMLTNVPSLYNPHDLQHLMYPQYISQFDLIHRETLTAAGCRFAHSVVAGTQWVKDDIVRRYGIDSGKIRVIPWASPTEFYKEPRVEDIAVVREKYQIETPCAIYPANSWGHKNHLRLLDAVGHLRDMHGLVVRVVCTGGRVEPFWSEIKARVNELRLGTQVKFLGTVSDAELRALYRLAQFLILPTLYEADSNPIHEAWFEGVPVASSNVTALPDQVADAGLLFDPRNVVAIADAMAKLSVDERLRDELRIRGRRRAGEFSWERTAKAYRAVYRQIGDVPLCDEDRWLLEWDWMREPWKARNEGDAAGSGQDVASSWRREVRGVCTGGE